MLTQTSLTMKDRRMGVEVQLAIDQNLLAFESGLGLTVLKISFVSGSGTNLPQGADSHRTN